jgi:hypothetical protein
MHVTIAILVENDDGYQSVKHTAETVCEQLCEETIFDYYNLEPDTDEDIGKIYDATSKEGKELIKNLLYYDNREFVDALSKIKEALTSKEDDELFVDEMFRHWCYKAGQYAGHCVSVYSDGCEGLRTQKEVDRLIEEMDNPHIILADMHY